MVSESVSYYLEHKDVWAFGGAWEHPFLIKIANPNYQLGRNNDHGINVDLFIEGYNEYNPTETLETTTSEENLQDKPESEEDSIDESNHIDSEDVATIVDEESKQVETVETAE